MDAKSAIMFVAIFYSISIFLMWIAKEEAIAKTKAGKSLSKLTNAYPWLIWVLTTALSITAYYALR